MQTFATIVLPTRGLSQVLAGDETFWRPIVLEWLGLEMLIERWDPNTVLFRTVKDTTPLEHFSLVYSVGGYIEYVQNSHLDWGNYHWATIDDELKRLINRSDASVALRYQM